MMNTEHDEASEGEILGFDSESDMVDAEDLELCSPGSSWMHLGIQLSLMKKAPLMTYCIYCIYFH